MTALCKYKSFKLKTSLNIFKVDYGKNTSIKGVVKKYKEIKDLLISPVNYAQCFGMEEIQGKKRYNQDSETGYPLCILDMTRITGFVM